MRIAAVFPGQGSHRPGVLDAWLAPGADGLVATRALVDQVSASIGRDVVALAADETTGGRTADAQPAIFAASMVAWHALVDAGVTADVVAGHSLGEYSASVAAGVMPLADGAALVAARGAAMAQACAINPGTMAAVVKLDPAAVEDLVAQVDGVVIANDNAAGQVVVAGPVDAVARVRDNAREAGGRGVALDVEGAFHSPAMEPAVERVTSVLAELDLVDPRVPLVTGVSGATLTSRTDVAEALLAGILAPVRWRDVQATMADLDITDLVEVGPGGVLAGLAKRALPSVRIHRLESPDDLPAIVAALSRHEDDDADESVVSQDRSVHTDTDDHENHEVNR
ncbi:MAG: ACP S-malonyltransferase [Nitriliruptoraceae bacterium]